MIRDPIRNSFSTSAMTSRHCRHSRLRDYEVIRYGEAVVERLRALSLLDTVLPHRDELDYMVVVTAVFVDLKWMSAESRRYRSIFLRVPELLGAG